jgi:hypothetical protein
MEKSDELTPDQRIKMKKKIKPSCRTLMWDGNFYHVPIELVIEKLWVDPPIYRRDRQQRLPPHETTTMWTTACEYQGGMTEVLVQENDDIENWCPACALLTLSKLYD